MIGLKEMCQTVKKYNSPNMSLPCQRQWLPGKYPTVLGSVEVIVEQQCTHMTVYYTTQSTISWDQEVSTPSNVDYMSGVPLGVVNSMPFIFDTPPHNNDHCVCAM